MDFCNNIHLLSKDVSLIVGNAILISECNYEYLEYNYVKKSLVLGSLLGSMPFRSIRSWLYNTIRC